MLRPGCRFGAGEARLPRRIGFQEQVDDQQLPVEMGLNARAITVRQVLTAEVDLEPFDGTFDA